MVFWLVSALIVSVPGQAPQWWASLKDLVGATPSMTGVVPLADVLRLVNVAELLAPVLIVTAVLTVLAAPLRGSGGRAATERRAALAVATIL
jgi:hypothetical protein